MLHISVKFLNDRYVAHFVKPNGALYCGEGNTIGEAIGQCFISNRESVDFIFDVTDKDGVIKYSTVYGKSRMAT